MAFCIGIRVRDGIVALADAQWSSGSERLKNEKLKAIACNDMPCFVMTTGLMSIRDKILKGLRAELESRSLPVVQVSKIVDLFGGQLRRVGREQTAALESSGLAFNTHAIIGGKLSGDLTAQLCCVSPNGTSIQATKNSPYFMLGRTPSAKPILDRLLTYDTPLRTAVVLALLAFDATRFHEIDMDCAIDVAVIHQRSGSATVHRYVHADIAETLEAWSDSLAAALYSIPAKWTNPLFNFDSVGS